MGGSDSSLCSANSMGELTFRSRGYDGQGSEQHEGLLDGVLTRRNKEYVERTGEEPIVMRCVLGACVIMIPPLTEE